MSKLKNHVYKYDEVVIGGNINAVLYAYKNENVILLNNVDVPFVFDFFDSKLDLKNIYFEKLHYFLKTNEGEQKVGTPKCKIWKYLIFLLTLAGLNPLANKIKTIRLEDDNLLKITTENSRLVRIKYDKLIIFDDANVYGLPPPKMNIEDKFKVFDWVDVRSGTKHEFDYFKTNDDFVNEIYFYSSLRIDGNNDKKDLVSISYLNGEELQNFNYSSTIAKFKIIRLMKDAGIKGSRNGKFKHKDEQAYSNIKIEVAKREVCKINKNVYDNYDDIIFNYDMFDQVLSKECKNENLVTLSNKVSHHRKFIT